MNQNERDSSDNDGNAYRVEKASNKMTKQDTCMFFAPYRSEKTRRPHPSKPGVCRATVSFPKLPNAYMPNLTPKPIYPRECKGCPFFVSRKLDFPQPTKQEVML